MNNDTLSKFVSKNQKNGKINRNCFGEFSYDKIAFFSDYKE